MTFPRIYAIRETIGLCSSMVRWERRLALTTIFPRIYEIRREIARSWSLKRPEWMTIFPRICAIRPARELFSRNHCLRRSPVPRKTNPAVFHLARRF